MIDTRIASMISHDLAENQLIWKQYLFQECYFQVTSNLFPLEQNRDISIRNERLQHELSDLKQQNLIDDTKNLLLQSLSDGNFNDARKLKYFYVSEFLLSDPKCFKVKAT